MGEGISYSLGGGFLLFPVGGEGVGNLVFILRFPDFFLRFHSLPKVRGDDYFRGGDLAFTLRFFENASPPPPAARIFSAKNYLGAPPPERRHGGTHPRGEEGEGGLGSSSYLTLPKY